MHLNGSIQILWEHTIPKRFNDSLRSPSTAITTIRHGSRRYPTRNQRCSSTQRSFIMAGRKSIGVRIQIGFNRFPVGSPLHSTSNWVLCLSLSVLDRFGFTRHKFTCTSELHSICAPGFCSESLSRKLHHSSSRISSKKYGSSTAGSSRSFYSSSSKSKKLREHFEYNHIPAMISSLQNYSVHGIVNGCSLAGGDFDDTIMLLIHSVVLEKSKFIIVDLKLNRFVCALGDDYHGLIDVKKVHSAWSRDRTQVIIRLPLLGGSSALDFYQSKRQRTISMAIASIFYSS